MECAFLKVGNHELCHSRSTKNSKYCKLHNYLMKKSKVKPCIKCGNGTYAKYQTCVPCGAHKVRLLHRYYEVVKPFVEECRRLGRIDIIQS